MSDIHTALPARNATVFQRNATVFQTLALIHRSVHAAPTPERLARGSR